MAAHSMTILQDGAEFARMTLTKITYNSGLRGLPVPDGQVTSGGSQDDERASVSRAILVCLFAASCAVNPVTGKKELSLISEQQELAIGKETDAEVRGQYGVYADDRLTAYVTTSGKALAEHTHRPNLAYRFAVLDSPVINAFAVPGGYIYLTRGILALMNSEAEMAVVLGHELGHVNARHSVRKMSQMILVQVGLAVGSALSDTFAKISGVAGIGVQLLFLKFSRDDEREADALGVEYYAGRAGYDPSRMVDFFTSLEKMGDLSGKGTPSRDSFRLTL